MTPPQSAWASSEARAIFFMAGLAQKKLNSRIGL
jgi:hypothetical protein